MNYTAVETKLSELGIKYLKSVPLSSYTSFSIGGEASLAAFPGSEDEAISLLSHIRVADVPYLILGNGTNVLASDKGFDGIVIIMSGLRGISMDANHIHVECGVPLTGLSLTAQKHSLSGLEFAYGIPGTVGGGVYMNAGAYGGELSQIVTHTRYFDMSTGEVGEYYGDEHEFSYRHSIYDGSDKVILSVDLTLKPGDGVEIRAQMDDYMNRRKEKQPLEYPSAGSVFKRGDGFITAKLIDEAGLRGRRVGDAQVSEKHAGFIVNRGSATAEDVLTLIEIIKNEVKEKFGVTIHCEVKYIG